MPGPLLSNMIAPPPYSSQQWFRYQGRWKWTCHLCGWSHDSLAFCSCVQPQPNSYVPEAAYIPPKHPPLPAPPVRGTEAWNEVQQGDEEHERKKRQPRNKGKEGRTGKGEEKKGKGEGAKGLAQSKAKGTKRRQRRQWRQRSKRRAT